LSTHIGGKGSTVGIGGLHTSNAHDERPDARFAALLRLGWAAVLFGLRRSGGVMDSGGRKSVAAALTLRHVAQGVVTLLHPSRRVLRIGAAVDATHAASMVGFAAVRPGPTRRLAIADAGLATGATIAGLVLVRMGESR
jgi:hypothetical protein